jgi:ABC-type lipoprotein release transport system permease subunit
MSDALVAAVDAASSGADVTSKPVITYLATSISGGVGSIPYSTVAAMDSSLLPPVTPSSVDGASPPLWLNAWAAADLRVAPGATIALDYFIWNDDDGLETRSARFTFAGVLEGPHALDPTLTPDYPGLTDQTRMADWDPPFPVDLTQVRRIDEDYWERHRAAPKAFMRLEDGRRLWASKYGTRSSTRLHGADGTAAAVRAQVLERLSASLGDITAAQFAVVPLRDERESAARGTTDFGEYFVYFSFFLVVSALLLAALFYRFGVEQRVREIGLLTAVGFTRRQILLTLGTEGAVLALAGTLLGMIGAWLFALLVVLGLRTWWVDAVGTTALDVHLGPIPLAAGAIGGLLAAVVSLVSAVSALTKQSARSLVAGVIGREADGRGERGAGHRLGPSRRRAAVAALTAAAALGLIALAQAGALDAVGGFFGAGLLLLLSGLTTLSWWLRSPGGAELTPSAYALPRLGARSLTYRPGRTTLSVALIAFATFVIVSVTAFRKDGADASRDRGTGTGGYTMLVETSVPLMHDPATAEGRGALNLTDAAGGAFARAHAARLRLRPGDDASCLNLYRPTRPRILGVSEVFDREGRFRFGSTLADTPDERAHPWRLLSRTFSDGALPAIVDANSLAYVFHLGIGDDIVLPREQGRQVRLRVVGTLVDSMFQSEVLIGDAAFERAFPDYEGFGVFLFELDAADDISAAEAAIERLWSDSGADAIDTGVRLASFHRVENTYLATFQTLGALGLLLGVFGLALILARNILERQRELGLLRAVGFEPRHLRTMVVSETAAMMIAGLATGAGAALVAIVPAIVARAQSLPFGWLAGMGVVIFVAGVSASLVTASLLRRLPLLRALRSE